MTFRMMTWCIYILEVMFFMGLIGCAVMVVTSWISIFKEVFSGED